MRFFAATLLAVSLSVTYAAPYAIHQNDVVRRKVDYQIVNVDGDSSTTTAPQTQTRTVIETETMDTTITETASLVVPKTVTVTETPSSSTQLSLSPSSIPTSHIAPPAGGSFFSPSASGFQRRELKSTPTLQARSYASSSCVYEASANPLVARHWGTPSVPVSTTPIAARAFVPSSASATPIIARDFVSSSVGVATPLAARQFSHLHISSSAAPSSTFSPSLPAIPMLY